MSETERIKDLLDMLVVDIPKRCAGIVLAPEDQRAKAYDRAVRLLERVADCKFAIDDPDTGETATGTASESINEPTSHDAPSDTLKGL